MITSKNDVFKDFESNTVVEISKLVNPTWETAESNITLKQTGGS